MTDDIDKTKKEIKNLSFKYKEISQKLAKPVPYFPNPGENELNKEISEVFLQAVSIINSTTFDPNASAEYPKYSSPEIIAVNTQISQLTEALNHNSVIFQNSLQSAKKIFSDSFNEISAKYENQITKLIEENNSKLEAAEYEAKEIQDQYDKQLISEISPHISECSKIQNQITSLKNQYETTEKRFLKEISNKKELLKELQDKKSNYNSQSQLDDLKAQKNALETEHKAKIEQLKAEQDNLKDELQKQDSFYQEENNRLEISLKELDSSFEERLKISLQSQLNTHQQNKMKLESEFKKKEIDLKRQITKEEQLNSVSTEKMAVEIEEQKKLIKDADYRYKNALHELEDKTNLQLEEREREKQNIEKANKKVLKQMATKHKEQLAAIKKEGEMARRSLEQKLQKTNEKKKLNDNQVQPPTTVQAKPSPRRLPRKSVPKYQQQSSNVSNEYNQEITGRIKNFEIASQKELDSISTAIWLVNSKAKLHGEISQIAINRTKRQLIQIEAQKEIISNRLKELASRLNKKSGQQESESKLHERISSQYNTITELKNDITKIKNDKIKVGLSAIQAEHKNELEKIRGRLTTIENSNKKKVSQVRDKYNSIVQNEIDRRTTELDCINKRIEEVNEEIARMKEMVQEIPFKEHQEWVRLRKETADSTHRMMGNLNSSEYINELLIQDSVKMLPADPKTLIPLLKH